MTLERDNIVEAKSIEGEDVCASCSRGWLMRTFPKCTGDHTSFVSLALCL